MKTKHELRQEAIERLKKDINYPGYYRALIKDIVGDDFDELTGHACVETIIDLLTDDDEMEGYIKLPCDKYGEPWHVGDVTENGNVVMGMSIDNTGEWYFTNTRNDIDPYAHYHYRKPSVEDVLREFAVTMSERMHLSNGVATTIAEYAPMLQLKEVQECE